MAQQPSNWIRFINGGAASTATGAAALLAELHGIALAPLADAAARGTFTAHAVQLALQAARAEMAEPDPHGLTLDERAAIYLYTLEVSPGYRELNRKLWHSIAAARDDFNYTKILQTALAKLPVFDGGIWRSINVDFETLRATYGVGSRVAWLSFNSCTVDGDIAQQFLGYGKRTLFMVDRGHDGVNISSYSSFPGESEILLPPAIELEVQAVISPSADLTIVHLAQVPIAVPTGVVRIKSAWPGAIGELMYCGGPKLNPQRRHVLTWIGGENPPTGPPGGELWDIQPTMTGHYTIKSAWPGATGELMYCGGAKLNEERRHVLTWIGGENPPTGPPGGELWDISVAASGSFMIKSAWPGATGEILYCGGHTLNPQRRHVLTWIGGELPPTGPPGGELWDIQAVAVEEGIPPEPEPEV